jgi:hypothetical protein
VTVSIGRTLAPDATVGNDTYAAAVMVDAGVTGA